MRKQILQAAAAEFALIGFESTRLETISERAGIGKGTIYLYFNSKQEVFKEMLQEIGQDQLAQLHAALDDKHTLPETLATLLATFYYLVREQPDEFRIFISSLYGVNRQFHEEAAKQRRAFLQLIEGVLYEARIAGEMTMDVEPAALLILTIMSGTLTLMADALGFEQDYIQRHHNQIVEMLLAALKVDA